MLEYQVRAICHLSKGTIKRALKSPENDWGNKLNAIRDCDVTCRNLNDVLWRGEAREYQSVQFRKMDEHRDLQLKALQAAADERQNGKVNNFLRGLTAAAGQYKRGKNINPTRVPGTCEWFVNNEDFCEWRNSQSSNLLWVSAVPGCGKSVLSRTLIDEDYLVTNLTVEVDPSGVYTLRGTSSTVCYFFFKHGDKSREKMTSSLCAILHQLLLSHGTEDLLDRAAEKYACQPTMLEDASEMWKIIEEYVNSWDTGDIICVLDGLDECNRESRDEFIQILHDFFDGERKPGQPRLKLLITSRPEYDLRLSFDSLPNSIYLHFDSDDKYEEISRDINLVIDSRVESMFKQRLPLKDQRAISNKLKSKENRTYLWLHLTLEIIRRKPAFYGRLRDIDDFLKSLPATVSDAYETILNRKAMDQEDNARKTRALLEVVLAATRPLHLDEANFALTMALQKDEFKSYEQFKASIWPGDFKSVVKDLCGHLINVYDEHLFFIHQTVREFLLAENEEGKNWQGSFSMLGANKTMFESCVNYLTLPDFPVENVLVEAINKTESEQRTPPLPLDDDPRNWGFVPENTHHFFMHSSLYWPYYCHSQAASDKNRAAKQLRRLFRPSKSSAPVWFTLFNAKDGIFSSTNRNWTELAAASRAGLLPVVNAICTESNAGINAVVERVGSALYVAAYHGHVGVVDALLSWGADFNIRGDDERYTPLHAAAKNGHREVAQLLLFKGAKVDDTTSGVQKTPLCCAAEDGHLETAKTLLAFGASVNGSGDEAVMTPLYSAINGNHCQMIRMLISEGADVNRHTHFGIPICRAAYRGHFEIACRLVAAGANSGDISRALHIAAGCGYYRITRMLLTAGADVNVRCGYRHQLNTPLYEAAVNGHEKVAQLLLSNGGDVLITEGTLAWIGCNEIISRFVRDMVGNAVPITPHLILAVARNKKGGDQIMSVILDKRGGDVRITEEVIESLLENSYAAYDLMNVLVQQHADDSQTTASLVQKEWRSHLRYEQVQPFLKQHPITRRMMMAGVRNIHQWREIIALLIKYRRDELLSISNVEHENFRDDRNPFPSLRDARLFRRLDEARAGH